MIDDESTLKAATFYVHMILLSLMALVWATW